MSLDWGMVFWISVKKKRNWISSTFRILCLGETTKRLRITCGKERITDCVSDKIFAPINILRALSSEKKKNLHSIDSSCIKKFLEKKRQLQFNKGQKSQSIFSQIM